jgi:hypothetical protein
MGMGHRFMELMEEYPTCDYEEARRVKIVPNRGP